MSNTIAVVHCVIVDDHQMVLELLVGAVSGIPGLEVAATATDVADAPRVAALSQVDLLIVDRQLKTGDGMELVRAVAARHPGVKCIVIAAATADFICPPDLLDVVVSVIDKSDACRTLLTEIARVCDLTSTLFELSLPSSDIKARLTARQWELFLALGNGLSNKELGRHFGISTRTVETHRKAIANKIGVSGAALLRLAVLQRRGRGLSVVQPFPFGNPPARDGSHA